MFTIGRIQLSGVAKSMQVLKDNMTFYIQPKYLNVQSRIQQRLTLMKKKKVLIIYLQQCNLTEWWQTRMLDTQKKNRFAPELGFARWCRTAESLGSLCFPCTATLPTNTVSPCQQRACYAPMLQTVLKLSSDAQNSHGILRTIHHNPHPNQLPPNFCGHLWASAISEFYFFIKA